MHSILFYLINQQFGDKNYMQAFSNPFTLRNRTCDKINQIVNLQYSIPQFNVANGYFSLAFLALV